MDSWPSKRSSSGSGLPHRASPTRAFNADRYSTVAMQLTVEMRVFNRDIRLQEYKIMPL